MRYRKNIGDFGEDFAANLLENSGFKIICRNYSTKFGEVDIIAVWDRTIHFVEVKTRTSAECGYPAESVTKYKQDKIRKTAKCYLNSRRYSWKNVSFDVFEIMTDLIEDCM